jgi:prepilin-type N-terminal cleavage/methylation domain-containing protein
MRIRLKPKQNDGFTLVETVAGMVIFLVASTAIIPVFMTYKLSTIRNDTRMGAVAIAQQVMDTLRKTDVASLRDPNVNTLGTSTSLPTAAGGGSLDSLSYKGKTYSATITYCETASYCDTTTKHIKVKVYPNGNTAIPPIYELETVYARLQ